MRLYGKHTNEGISFAFPLNTTYTETTLELPNGPWKFSAIGWGGDSALPLEGDVRCGIEFKELQGFDTAIDITINMANCLTTGQFSSDSNYFDSIETNQFKKLDNYHLSHL